MVLIYEYKFKNVLFKTDSLGEKIKSLTAAVEKMKMWTKKLLWDQFEQDYEVTKKKKNFFFKIFKKIF